MIEGRIAPGLEHAVVLVVDLPSRTTRLRHVGDRGTPHWMIGDKAIVIQLLARFCPHYHPIKPMAPT